MTDTQSELNDLEVLRDDLPEAATTARRLIDNVLAVTDENGNHPLNNTSNALFAAVVALDVKLGQLESRIAALEGVDSSSHLA
jgi:hypothetical protein